MGIDAIRAREAAHFLPVVNRLPVALVEGRGSRVRDADGREYVDLVGSWGPMILGHANPKVRAAIHAAVDRGTSFGAPTVAESHLAELIIRCVPSIEKVRLVKGQEKPIRIEIDMSNSAGIFQVDELLKYKLRSSGIEKYIEVAALVQGETEKQLVRLFNL